MKKLLLIPTTIITALLAVAFVSPATATGAVRAVVPHLHLVGVSSSSALADSWQVPAIAGSSGLSATSGSSGASRQDSASSGSAASPVGTSGQWTGDQAPPPVGHSQATGGQENCGRFGNGFHGGKHLFVCPNRPFPPPPNH